MPRTRKPPTPPETYEVQINPNTLAIALESALQSATAPLREEIAQLKAEVSQLRAEQADSHRSMSQMLGVWSQELRNAAAKPPNSKGKPSELEKQLKVLSTALGSWSRQQQQLLDSMDSLSKKLSD